MVPAPDIRMHQQQSMPTQRNHLNFKNYYFINSLNQFFSLAHYFLPAPPIGFVQQYPNPAGAYPLQQNYAPYPQPVIILIEKKSNSVYLLQISIFLSFTTIVQQCFYCILSASTSTTNLW